MITYMQKLYAIQSLHSMLLLKAHMRSFLIWTSKKEQALKKRKENILSFSHIVQLVGS